MTNQRFVVDTNIFILLFNERLVEPLPTGDISCSIITEMELLSFPDLSAAEERLIRERLSSIMVHALDHPIKEEAIRLRRSARLKLPDAVVVATAPVHGATLITNDRTLHDVPNLDFLELPILP
jgi:predicted nucleic acid-binding protein